MANVAITARDHYTNIIEFTGATMSAVNDAMDVPAHSSTYTFAATVTGGANFQLALECSFNGNWFTIDTSKTINSDGSYAYFYDGKAAARIRIRIASISSGTPSIVPHIAVGYNG